MKLIIKVFILTLLVVSFSEVFSQQGQDIRIEYSTKPSGKDSVIILQTTYQNGYENILKHPALSKADAQKTIISTSLQQDTLMLNIQKAIEALEQDQEKIRAEYDLYPKRLADQLLQVIDRKNQLKMEYALSKKIKEHLEKIKL